MSKYAEIFNFMRQCPALSKLWSVGATEEQGVRVIMPSGSSGAYQYVESKDAIGGYNCTVIPTLSIYEDYQINCYEMYDSKDSSNPEDNINVLSLDEVQSIIDWVFSQNEAGNMPEITGKNVVSIECNPMMPQVRYVNTQENMIAYFITVRLRYVNDLKQRYVEYGRD